MAVHQTKCRVAAGQVVDQHAHGAHVEKLMKIETLALHLAPDRIDVLGPATDLVGNAGGFELFRQLLHERVDVALALVALFGHQPFDARAGLGIQIAECKVFQWPLELPDAKPVGQRGVYRARLARQRSTGLVVAGDLHARKLPGQHQQHHANVVDQRKNEAPEALGAAGGIRQVALVEMHHAAKLLDQRTGAIAARAGVGLMPGDDGERGQHRRSVRRERIERLEHALGQF